MIKKYDNGSLLMKFDTGDIGITIGGDYGRGAIMFHRQEPQNATFLKNYNSIGYAKTSDFPVSMVFTDPDSIDVLIKSLWAAKKILEGQIVLHVNEVDNYQHDIAAAQ